MIKCLQPIQSNEYAWTSAVGADGKTNYGASISKTSELAKKLMSSQDNAAYYNVVDDQNIQVKNGIYTLQYMNQYCNYAFDANGNMQTGIVEVADNEKVFLIDPNTGDLVESATNGKAKYYFYDGEGAFKGIMWTLPIVIDNVLYTFGEDGKVLTETVLVSY